MSSLASAFNAALRSIIAVPGQVSGSRKTVKVLHLPLRGQLRLCAGASR